MLQCGTNRRGAIKTDNGMTVPTAVLAVLERLERNGHEAYLVGGCVRDWLRGGQPKDYDVTTDATAEQNESVFSDHRVIGTGLRHGTVTVISDGMPVEVTTYRVDGDYSDGRHPDSVVFTTDLRADLSRRDFTVNAMAYSPWRGLVDVFGGEADLREKRIRCVGDPDRRFEEDALRIMRAMRFASVMGFSVEEKTAAAIHRNRFRLEMIAKERITEELFRLLCGDGAESVLRAFADVMAVVLPPVAAMFGFAQRNPHHVYDVWEHTLRVVSAAPPDRGLRLAALLHDIGKPSCFTLDEAGVGHFYGHAKISEEITQEIFLRYLRVDNHMAARVRSLVRFHDEPILPARRSLRRRLTAHGEVAVRDLLALQRADAAGQSPACLAERLQELAEAEALLDTLVREKVCMTVRDLAVDGRSLMRCGIPQGSALGRIMQTLLREVTDEILQNEPEALCRRAQALYAASGEKEDGSE